MGCSASGLGSGRDQLHEYIDKHAELWTMLSVNLGVSEEQCKQVALRVAVDIAKHPKNGGSPVLMKLRAHEEGRNKRRTEDLSISSSEFERFNSEMNTPQGYLLFFHRTIFESFDIDNNKVLDRYELDRFLETYYSSSSIFAADARLPPKDQLKRLIYESLDKNSDGLIDFDEIRPFIAGKVKFDDTDDRST